MAHQEPKMTLWHLTLKWSRGHFAMNLEWFCVKNNGFYDHFAVINAKKTTQLTRIRMSHQVQQRYLPADWVKNRLAPLHRCSSPSLICNFSNRTATVQRQPDNQTRKRFKVTLKFPLPFVNRKANTVSLHPTKQTRRIRLSSRCDGHLFSTFDSRLSNFNSPSSQQPPYQLPPNSVPTPSKLLHVVRLSLFIVCKCVSTTCCVINNKSSKKS